jgi:hypothetical protein
MGKEEVAEGDYQERQDENDVLERKKQSMDLNAEQWN